MNSDWPAVLFDRSKDHDHLPAFKLRRRFNLGDFGGLLADFVQKFHAQILVGHFTAAESKRNFHLVTVIEETQHVFHLHFVIVSVDVRTHLDLFDLNGLLLLASFCSFLLGLIFVTAVVQDLADWGVGIWLDFYQIQAGIHRDIHRFFGRHDAAVGAFMINQLDFANANFIVSARAFLRRRRGAERTANGRNLLYRFT